MIEMETINREALEAAYESTLADVAIAKAGTEEAKWNLQKLETLHKMKMAQLEADGKAAEREQNKKDVWIDRVVNGTLKVASIGAPLMVCWALGRMGLEFEEKGSIASKSFAWASGLMRFTNLKNQ